MTGLDVKMKTRFLVIIGAIIIITIPISIGLWTEYGMACNNAVVDHLQKYSNVFDDGITYDTYRIEAIGFPFGVHEWNVKECVNFTLEKRTFMDLENTEPVFTGISLLNDTEAILDIYAIQQIQRILDKCDYIQKLESGEIPTRNLDGSYNIVNADLHVYNNGTHYIDNNICIWIDSFESVTYQCFESTSIEQNWYSGPDNFDNGTHHLDVQQCKWTNRK